MNKFITLLFLAAFFHTALFGQCNPDTEPPVVVAINGLGVNIMPTGMIVLWATDFLSGALDNCTPEPQLQLGLRKAGEGAGFPINPDGSPQISITYVCCDGLGTKIIELWARDAAGNSSVDSAYFIFQDNWGGVCDCLSASVSGCAYTPSEKIISDSRWEITGNHPALPPATIFQVADCMQFTGIPLLGNYAITPGKNDDPLDGVSTYDLVKINKHILGLEPFANPYQIIAADANNSRTITTFDIIELRKLILGIYTEFPNNKSWRFIPKGYQFQNPANPFAEIFPEQIDLPNLMASVEQIDFTGIKTGDINGNTIDDSLQTAPATRTPIRLQLDDGFLRPSETVRMALHFDEELDLLGLQFALLFDPALLDISGLALSERLTSSQPLTPPEAWFAQPEPGQLTFSWDSPIAQKLPAGEAILFFEIKAKQALHLSRVLQLNTGRLRPEVYPADGSIRPFEINFSAAPKISRTEVFPAVPNPSSGPVYIPLALAEAATARLEVFGLNGRQLYKSKHDYPAGLQQLVIPATALSGQGKVLVYRLQVGEQLFCGKLLRL